MNKRLPWMLKQRNISPDTLQGPIVIDIHITIDGKGLMKTNITGNPAPNVMQVVTALTDCMKGYMDTVNQQASMIIDPNKPEPSQSEQSNGGKETENNHNG